MDCATQHTMSDQDLLDYLGEHGDATIVQMVAHFRVTATAIRNRLPRLIVRGVVSRMAKNIGRGRPVHLYRLSSGEGDGKAAETVD